jgi:hypothetical protein
MTRTAVNGINYFASVRNEGPESTNVNFLVCHRAGMTPGYDSGERLPSVYPTTRDALDPMACIVVSLA